MAEPSTFIKLYRNMLDHWLWEEKPFSKGQAWIDLLLVANYADEKRLNGNKVRVYPRGCVPRSLASLAKRWGWDKRTVKNFLLALENDKMVSLECTTRGTTVTIENYSKFQNVRTTKRTTNSPLDVPRSPRSMYPIKESKESKESKEEADEPPSLDAGWSPPKKGTPEYDAWRNQ